MPRAPEAVAVAAVVVLAILALALFAMLPELSLVSAPVYRGF